MQAIFYAIRNGAHAEAADAIAEYNLDINVHYGTWSILNSAVLNSSIPAIEALAARGDVNFQTNARRDLISLSFGYPATLRAVLRCFPGVELNTFYWPFCNKTALAHAALYGCMESVQLLLNAGADPALGAPHVEARMRGNEAIAMLIEQHAAWVNGLRHVWTRAIVDASVFGVVRL